MRRFVAVGPAFVVLAALAVLLLAAPALVYRLRAAETGGSIVVARRELGQNDILSRMSQATRDLAQVVEPSVVHIEIFGRPADGGVFGSSGSGWIFDDRGHIITNAHVVSGASIISVQFHDGKVAAARIVGSDPFNDIAVLKSDRERGLFPIERSSGGILRQGDRVYAFGSPFGFKFSMSEGIVSGLGRIARGVTGVNRSANYIQTDAAVNPGNSGGPLVDVNGRLVGMNVAIATAAETDGSVEGQSSGISFAIPLTTIESRVAQIIETGGFEPGYMGISLSNRDTVSVELDEFTGTGVRIGEVVAEAPAGAAGLKAGDIVIFVDDEATPNAPSLLARISAARPGQTLRLRIVRDDTIIAVSVTLGSAPAVVRNEQLRELLISRSGIHINDAEGRRPPTVVGVRPGSVAERAGFAQGQIIVAIGGRDVATETEAFATLSSRDFLAGDDVAVTVLEAGQVQSVTRELRLRLGQR